MTSYESDPWLIRYAELFEIGNQFALDHPDYVEKEISRGLPQDIAVMIQTSGTTGVPKIAMLSHRNLTTMAAQWVENANIQPEENSFLCRRLPGLSIRCGESASHWAAR